MRNPGQEISLIKEVKSVSVCSDFLVTTVTNDHKPALGRGLHWVKCSPYKLEDLTCPQSPQKRLGMVAGFVLGRQRQAEPCGLLISQARLLGEFQINERHSFKRKCMALEEWY